MITTYEIEHAVDTNELDALVEKAAAERNCELDASSSYAESADFFEEEAPKAGNGEEGMRELIDILRSAESRWFDLEA